MFNYIPTPSDRILEIMYLSAEAEKIQYACVVFITMVLIYFIVVGVFTWWFSSPSPVMPSPAYYQGYGNPSARSGLSGNHINAKYKSFGSPIPGEAMHS